MLPSEFEPGMNRLVKIFKPRDWDQETSDAYLATVRRWSVDEWDAVVDEVIRDCEYFPKPRRMMAARAALRQADETDGATHSTNDCNCCHAGLIQFATTVRGVEYDKVCACVCGAGMQQLTKLYGGYRMRSYIEVFGSHPKPIDTVPVPATQQTELEPEPKPDQELVAVADYNDDLPF
tara:strand:+ start:1254 stop:1787 length:534 start_codon:yes stop_codon:yes gene_type:complete